MTGPIALDIASGPNSSLDGKKVWKAESWCWNEVDQTCAASAGRMDPVKIKL
jgi:hypothetical protein